ncbi:MULTISPECIES: DUF1648 domain-containing protein [unclassified Viridibacillus]|uniref:DUF1648 domain-containing protein n=1 Tax=unclassified Viridibacillus TaxID=2617942 RepID=UPI00096EFC68|nr:DUF1648 domain-containing protein [Viridibacillus sp. FSL H8-0123]OMC78403.1 hypothetical protein BK130_20420 [Viridibacillus sp. FSL H8-0123]
MFNQPKLVIPRSAVRTTFDILAIGIFVVAIIYGITQWSSLPSEVPTHYNALGVPDDWGPRWMFFLPPIIGVVLWLFCHVLEQKPHLHNYSTLTADNTERLYKNSMLLLNFVKNEILLFFAFNIWNDVHIARGGESLLGVYEMPLFLAILFGTIIFFVVRFFKLR